MSGNAFGWREQSREWVDQAIAESLMRSLGVVVGAVLREGVAQRPWSDEDHSVQALRLDRTHESLGERVAVRRSGRAEDDATAVVFERTPERIAELPVAIEDQEPLLPQKSVDAVGQIPSDLIHEVVVGVRRAADDRHGARGEVDDEERVVRHQPAGGPNLGREEVTGRDRGGVRAQELPPGRPIRAFGCRVDAVLLQDLLDGVRGDDVTEIRERAMDAVVSPGQVLARHPDDELGDALHHELPIGLSARERPLLRDELSMPAQDRLRRDDRGELAEDPPAERGTAHREPHSLVVGRTKLPATELSSEDSVLLAEVLEDALLVAVQPASEDDG